MDEFLKSIQYKTLINLFNFLILHTTFNYVVLHI
jgi:hypothetical protein